MKAGRFCFSFWLLLSISTGVPASAGTLGPRLAALLTKRAAMVRSDVGNYSPPSKPFQPRLDSAGRVQMYVRPVDSKGVQEVSAELQKLAAVDIVSSPIMRVVQAWVPVDELSKLAALGDVSRVTVPAYADARPVAPALPNSQSRDAFAETRTVPTGLAIDSQAPAAMQALTLIANGADGAGVKVGVMSGDISGLAASQAAGYLPASIWDDPNYPGTSPIPGNPAEGTALLEILHAVAPDASLGFCAPVTSVDVLACYKDMIHWGATVIANDMQLHSTDMFAAGFSNDGSVAYAAQRIAEAHPGVAFVNVAGNEAQDYFQAPYTPGPGASLNGIQYPSLMDFGVASGGSSSTRLAVKFNYVSVFTPVLEWNDPVNTSADSFVLALVDRYGRVLATGTPFTTSDGRPGVSLNFVPSSVSQPVFIEIACKTCSNPVTLKLNGFADGAATFASNTLGSVGYGQAVIPGTITAAAASVSHVNPLSVIAEFFTGPGPFLYGDFGATGTEVKPDLSGVDNIVVSGAGGFGSGGPAPGGGVIFLGTSAAAPNIAGLLADLMSGVPGSPASAYYNALRNTANRSAFPLAGSASAFDVNASGTGLVQGVGAWNALSSRTIPYIMAVNPTNSMPGKALDLTVSGEGFMNGASVSFAGSALTTTFVSATRLTAEVPAGLAATAGSYELVVSNPHPADTVSNTINYVLGNSVPTVSNWSPQSIVAGSSAFTLIVHGSNFVDGAVIMLNHVAEPTRFVSATELTAVIPVSAIAQAGSYPLAVRNPGASASSASVDFSVTAQPQASKSSGGGGSVGVFGLMLLVLCSTCRRRGTKSA